MNLLNNPLCIKPYEILKNILKVYLINKNSEAIQLFPQNFH